jgi:predicted DNA-binding transcriptional regulator AlpA
LWRAERSRIRAGYRAGGQIGRRHIARLEKAKQFPRRIMLGQCRVAWRYEEVRDWIDERVARRDAGSKADNNP